MRKATWLTSVAVATVVASGCATTGTQEPAQAIDSKISAQRAEIESLKADLQDRERSLREKQETIERLAQTPAVSSQPPSIAGSDDLFPPNAKPGECYARLFVPPQFETKQVRVLKRAAAERLEIVPATYEWVDEKVLVKEASSRLEVVPATYEWVEEKVLVKPASSKLVEVAAKYEWTEEKVLEKPAHTVWKKGRGPIERVDNATGEIMCLVEIPAKYRTVRKRIMAAAPTTKEITIPAEYKTVRKRVQKTAAATRTIEIPAEYKTVRVRRQVNSATTRKIDIPAEYQTVTKTDKLAEGKMAWRSILCETNATPALISQLQRALAKAGFDPGPVDGRVGAQTISAVKAYQTKKGLPRGNITTATLKSLGIEIR